jgi:ABC-type transporter Mla subunit MlaD
MIMGVTVLLLLASVQPAWGQQPPKPGAAAQVEQAIEASGLVPALEAVAAAATPELERALDQLSAALSGLAARIANDAELRLSAARAARGLADVAEDVVVEQSLQLQEALRGLAERIEALTAGRERKLIDPRRGG